MTTNRLWLVETVAFWCSIAIGYDEGTIMIKIGRDEPVASMDSSGKIIWAKHNEIQTVNVKSVPPDFEVCSHSTRRPPQGEWGC